MGRPGGVRLRLRVIVTRPAKEAQHWVSELARRGLDAVALPLIEIAPVPGDALQAAWRHIDQYAALMFVSGNAVEQFFAARASTRAASADGLGRGPQPPAFDGPSAPRCLATGPGTRSALLQAGVPAALIDCPGSDAVQFDTEALWHIVGARGWRGARVLIVRGRRADGDAALQGDGRDWLAGQLAAAGATVDFVVAYERRTPVLSAAQQALVRDAAGDGSVWLFSSSEAIGHLPRRNWAGARAIATHPRIALAARDAGFGVVCESRPALDEVVRSIESLE